MKTLKDLPKNTNIQTVKVELSDELYNSSSLPTYDIKSKEVYLVGPGMRDWFVKTDLASSQIYPMFRDYISWDELKDLKIAKNEK